MSASACPPGSMTRRRLCSPTECHASATPLFPLASIPVTDANRLPSISRLVGQGALNIAAACAGVSMWRFGGVDENFMCPLERFVSTKPFVNAQPSGIVPVYTSRFFHDALKGFSPMWSIKTSKSFAVISPSNRPLKNGSQYIATLLFCPLQ